MNAITTTPEVIMDVEIPEFDAAAIAYNEAEAAYWETEAQAEYEAEMAYERYLEDQGEDDPHERELWATDPQINGEAGGAFYGVRNVGPIPAGGDPLDETLTIPDDLPF